MIKRLVIATGPEALTIAWRVVELIGQKHRTWICAGHVMAEFHGEKGFAFVRHSKLHHLGEAARVFHRSDRLGDMAILAIRPEPPPNTWRLTLPFPVTIDEIHLKTKGRFEALERTTRLIGLLGLASPEIEARLTRAVDP